MLKAYHVMPLLPGREAELAEDAKMLLESGVCTDIACMMTLVPEGTPPDDKAAVLGARFLAFRDAFLGDKGKVGILAQATIGHGYVPDEAAPFQNIVRPDGMSVYQMCPLDEGFQAHMRQTFLALARLKPAFIMIDDDFRLLSGRGGCYCPLHLKAAEAALGRAFTREELVETLLHDQAAARMFDTILQDSLLGLAGVIRDAIDEVDPSIPGSFCTCTNDIPHADAISRRLAGHGQRREIRINNARYLSPEMRSFPARMYEGAAQAALLGKGVTVLAETDTCPQNRYSTGANLLHSHYTGSIWEGCAGAKHWITRTSAFQPRSGQAYRAVLKEHSGFYEELHRAVSKTAPASFLAAALPNRPLFCAAPQSGSRFASDRTWGALLGVLGLPCNYAQPCGLPALMTKEDTAIFSDDELRDLLGSGLLLEGRAAEALCVRGFSEEIGVWAEPWEGPRVSAERWEDVLIEPDTCYTKLTPAPHTAVGATLLHSRSGVNASFTEMGPAATLFENALGGRVAVLSASFGRQNALSSYGFFDENRKRQLVSLLSFVCRKPIPLYYPGDAEVYLKLRRYEFGDYLLGAFNLGHDMLETLPLALDGAAAHGAVTAHMLTPKGDWEAVVFEEGALQTPLWPARPKVFRLAHIS